LIDALAFTTLIKFGVWAVVMNLLTFMETGFISWIGLMLIASHSIMAVQAILFLPHLEVKKATSILHLCGCSTTTSSIMSTDSTLYMETCHNMRIISVILHSG